MSNSNIAGKNKGAKSLPFPHLETQLCSAAHGLRALWRLQFKVEPTWCLCSHLQPQLGGAAHGLQALWRIQLPQPLEDGPPLLQHLRPAGAAGTACMVGHSRSSTAHSSTQATGPTSSANGSACYRLVHMPTQPRITHGLLGQQAGHTSTSTPQHTLPATQHVKAARTRHMRRMRPPLSMKWFTHPAHSSHEHLPESCHLLPLLRLQPQRRLRAMAAQGCKGGGW